MIRYLRLSTLTNVELVQLENSMNFSKMELKESSVRLISEFARVLHGPLNQHHELLSLSFGIECCQRLCLSRKWLDIPLWSHFQDSEFFVHLSREKQILWAERGFELSHYLVEKERQMKRRIQEIQQESEKQYKFTPELFYLHYQISQIQILNLQSQFFSACLWIATYSTFPFILSDVDPSDNLSDGGYTISTDSADIESKDIDSISQDTKEKDIDDYADAWPDLQSLPFFVVQADDSLWVQSHQENQSTDPLEMYTWLEKIPSLQEISYRLDPRIYSAIFAYFYRFPIDSV